MVGILSAGNGRESLILHTPEALPHASATQNQSYLDHLWVGHGDLGGLLGGLDHADGVGHRVCKGGESVVSISTKKDIPGSLLFTDKWNRCSASGHAPEMALAQKPITAERSSFFGSSVYWGRASFR